MRQIIDYATNDERIKAVYLNGSRTNINAPSDIFRDFDIVYVVDEIKPFIEDKAWIDNFGEILIMQEPEYNDKWLGREVDFDSRYAYLMLFSDGIRIDLSFQSISFAKKAILEDKLVMKLLDKGQVLPSLDRPTDIQYHVKKPSEAQFITRANDFWWCMQNIAKGLYRDEIPYAMGMYSLVRKHLEVLLDWYIGMKNDFGVSTGKMHKYYKRCLDKSIYQRYLLTYPEAKIEAIWDSIFVCADLFGEVARNVSEELGINYKVEEEKAMLKYLSVVKNLDKDAVDIIP
jgi:aminoglycoside 6-adenylyltransferase